MYIRAVLSTLFLLFSIQFATAQDPFQTIYELPRSAEERLIHDKLQASEIFDQALNHLNETFMLPAPLTVRIGAQEGPLYDPELKEIWFPYAFYSDMEDLFKRASYDGPQAESLALDVIEHTLYHEVGHALIHILDLPTTGREEDAVDALATVMLINLFEDGGEVSISAAEAFGLHEEEDGVEDAAYWGEHSLDAQRFYAILCLTLGSDPEAHQENMPEELLKETDRCVEEWETQSRNWDRLLEPFTQP